jgi:hypothetical protein
MKFAELRGTGSTLKRIGQAQGRIRCFFSRSANERLTDRFAVPRAPPMSRDGESFAKRRRF